MAIILISSVPLTVLFSMAIYFQKQPQPHFGGYEFPYFYLEEPYLYLNYRDERFLVLNNSDFQQLDLLGDLEVKKSYRSFLAKYNDYLFLYRHLNEKSLEIIDVSDKNNPQLIAELQLPTGYEISAGDVYIHEFIEINNSLYFFIQDNDRTSFLVVNCTNIQQPELVDGYQFPGEAGEDFTKLHKFYIRDNTVFIPTLNATSSVGLTIYNFTSLDNFTKIGEWFGNTYLSSIVSVFVSEDYLYFKKWNSGVEVFNIQNLTHPTRKGFVTVPGVGLYCHRNYAFGFYNWIFSIYDCSNTSNTEPIFTYNYPIDTYIHYSYMSENVITNNYFYLPMHLHGKSNETLHIWNWSDPSNPTIKALFGLPTIPPLEEPLNWTYAKIIAPIIIGDLLVTILGIFLLRRLRVKKKN